ncbi:MAG: nucleotidyltransferase family protein [Cyclobacteriaceae bacterium]|nr:nucleotidyltransferase family protein [Cyclobacteriaceae bacterium]
MLTRQNILHVLQSKKEALRQYGVKNIGLFGSYQKNKQTNHSDIDILIDFNAESETYDNLMSIYAILEESFGSEKLEIVTKNGLSKHIGKHILSETEYV